MNNEELIKLYKETKNEKYLYELRENNKKFLYKQYKNFLGFLDKDDVEYAYDYALTKSLKMFDPNSGNKFLTLLSTAILKELLRLSRNMNKYNERYPNMVYYNQKLGYDDCSKTIDEYATDENLQTNPIYFKDRYENDENMIDTIVELAYKNKKIKYLENKKEDKKILYLLCKGYSQSELAKMLGVSRATITLRLKKIRNSKRVKNYINGIIK